ncbi:MAG: alpha/beta fold hydrolase [Dehalococcoidia bacterium]
MEPEQRFYASQRLRLSYCVWGDERKPPVLLVHGGRDHARNWDFVADALTAEWSVYAVDLRGHGDSEWAPGGMYSIPEFTADVAAFADHLDRDPLPMVGHSLGGGIVLQYAGVFPKRVSRVASVEGLGPGIAERRPAHLRMRKWIAQVREFEQRNPRHYATLAEAVHRMQEANSHLTPEMARHLAEHGVRRMDDGTFIWKFDNYVRMHSPYEFMIDDARELWNQIRSPVLLIRGDKSWAKDPERDGKASAFHDYRSIQIPDAGHWVHHDQLDAFLAVLLPFLRGEG